MSARANAPSRLPAPLSSYSGHAALRASPFGGEEGEGEGDADLSPGSTTLADSNPGLVSDREDDDDYVDVDDDDASDEPASDDNDHGANDARPDNQRRRHHRRERPAFQTEMVVIEDGSDGEGRGLTRKRLGGRGPAAEGVVVEGVCARGRLGEGSGRMG